MGNTTIFENNKGLDINKNETQLLVFINRADTHVMVRESDETEEALVSLKAITVLPYRLCQRTMPENYARELCQRIMPENCIQTNPE